MKFLAGVILTIASGYKALTPPRGQKAFFKEAEVSGRRPGNRAHEKFISLPFSFCGQTEIGTSFSWSFSQSRKNLASWQWLSGGGCHTLQGAGRSRTAPLPAESGPCLFPLRDGPAGRVPEAAGAVSNLQTRGRQLFTKLQGNKHPLSRNCLKLL